MPRGNNIPKIINILGQMNIRTTAKYNSRGVPIGITSIDGTKYSDINLANITASNIADVQLNPRRSTLKEIKSRQNRYVHPIFPLIKETAKVVSKSGKTYYRTFLVQDVKLEHAYRSLEYNWNKVAKEGTNGNVRGRLRSSGFVNYYARRGRVATNLYIRTLHFRTIGTITLEKGSGSLDIIKDVLRDIYARADRSTEEGDKIAQKCIELLQRIDAQAGKTGINYYTMSQTRQTLYDGEGSLTEEQQLEVIEKFIEDEEKHLTNKRRVYSGTRIRI